MTTDLYLIAPDLNGHELVNTLTEQAIDHALQKKGVLPLSSSEARSMLAHEGGDSTSISVLGEFGGLFVKFDTTVCPSVMAVQVPRPKFESMIDAMQNNVAQSTRIKIFRPNEVWIDVVLDDNVSINELRDLIDASYAIAIESDDFGNENRALLDLLNKDLDERELIRQLLIVFGLEENSDSIVEHCAPSARMKIADQQPVTPPPGSSKLGGAPDVLPGFAWPMTSRGQPMNFIAQINCREIQAVSAIETLPATGLILLFSAWGWTEGEHPYPELNEPNSNWSCSQAVYMRESSSELVKQPTPPRATEFQSASLEFQPILSLPNANDPELARRIQFTPQQEQDLNMLVPKALRQVRDRMIDGETDHCVGGHVDYIQPGGVPHEALASRCTLLLKVDTDWKINMNWGDDGAAYFFVKASQKWNEGSVLVLTELQFT